MALRTVHLSLSPFAVTGRSRLCVFWLFTMSLCAGLWSCQLADSKDSADIGIEVSVRGSTFIETRESPPSEKCPNGGILVLRGNDWNQDNALAQSEIHQATELCHGATGVRALVHVEEILQGDVCPAGGFGITFGFDENQNDGLEENEKIRSDVLCHGEAGQAGLTSLLRFIPIDKSELCPAGGFRIETGVDISGNLLLDEDEVSSSAVVCHGQPGDAGQAGSSCSAVRDEENRLTRIERDDGTTAVVRDGASGAPGPTGARGDAGANGSGCTATRDEDAGEVTIRCEDGTTVVLRDGADGAAGPNGDAGPPGTPGSGCTATRIVDAGIVAVSCEDGTTANVYDSPSLDAGMSGAQGVQGPQGETGSSCSVVRDDVQRMIVISCTDGTSVSIRDGRDGDAGPQGEQGPTGAAGSSCSVRRDDDLELIMIECDDGTSATLRDGADADAGPRGPTGPPGSAGSSCTTTRDEEQGRVLIECDDGTSAVIADGRDGATGPAGQQGSPGSNGSSCSVERDDESRTTRLFCEDGTSVTVRDGERGGPGAIGPTGNPGEDGLGCTVTREETLHASRIACEDGTSALIYDGEAGNDGAAGFESIIRLDGEPGGPVCALSGVRISSGLDENRNGELEDNEVDDQAVLCLSTRGSCAENYVSVADGSCVKTTPLEGAFGGMRFVHVPSGSFRMGSSTDELGRFSEEVQHEVALSRSFALSVTEVTQQQWSALTKDANPAGYPTCGSDCPVENIDWYATLAFANALSAASGLPACYELSPAGCTESGAAWQNGTTTCTGATFVGIACSGFRLPTAAEWEYAYRAGTTTAYYNGDNSQLAASPLDPTLNEIGWYRGNSEVGYEGAFDCSGSGLEGEFYPGSSRCGPHPVGGKLANAWGLFDMAGNVWEWVWDWSGSYSDVPIDPLGPTTGTLRVRRGGSWTNGARDARAAMHWDYQPNQRGSHIGFRLARTLVSCSTGEHDGGGGTCVPESSCTDGFHDNGEGVCVYNTRPCSLVYGRGIETWADGKWSSCEWESCSVGFHNGGNDECVPASECSEGFHLEVDACFSNERGCTVENGTGTQVWEGSDWGSCVPNGRTCTIVMEGFEDTGERTQFVDLNVPLTLALSIPDSPEISTVDWEITRRPSESLSLLDTIPTNRTKVVSSGMPGFDVSGRYTIVARAHANSDSSHIYTCSRDVFAIGDDIYVELLWHKGVGDLDLHLIKESDSGHYCGSEIVDLSNALSESCAVEQLENICFYQNCKPASGTKPDWDESNTVSPGDPALNIEDLCGFGPESIHLERATNDSYLIGVDFFGFTGCPGEGDIWSTVRIFAFGTSWERHRELSEGDWWESAIVHVDHVQKQACIEDLSTNECECTESVACQSQTNDLPASTALTPSQGGDCNRHAECPSLQRCDLSTGTCRVPTCGEDADCGRKRCDPNTLQCYLPTATCNENDEPNNTFDNAILFQNPNYLGTLCRGDNDILIFDATVGHRYTIDVEFADFDAAGNQIVLLNAEGDVLDRETVSLRRKASVATIASGAETERFYVNIVGLGMNSDDWSYTVQITESIVPSAPSCTDELDIGIEPNNDFSSAYSVDLGSPKSFSRCGTSDVDFYRIAVPPLHGLQVKLEYEPSEGDLDITLYDAPDSQKWVDSSATSNAVESVEAPEGATEFWIKVERWGFDGSVNQIYTLTATAVPRPAVCSADVHEPDMNPTLAADLALDSQPMTALRCNATDVDFYQITVPAQRRGEVLIRFAQQHGDLRLDLMNNEGEIIASSNDSAISDGESSDEVIELPFSSESVTYFVRVRLHATSGSLGQAYEISATTYDASSCLISEPVSNDSHQTGRCIGAFETEMSCAGNQLPNMLSPPDLATCAAAVSEIPGCATTCGVNDKDWYRIGKLNDGQSLQASLNHDPSLGVLQLAVVRLNNPPTGEPSYITREFNTSGEAQLDIYMTAPYLDPTYAREYALVVEAAGEGAYHAQPYALSVVVGEPCIEDDYEGAEGNDLPGSAYELVRSTNEITELSLSGTLCGADTDFFALSVVEGEQIRVVLEGTPEMTVDVGIAGPNSDDTAIVIPCGRGIVEGELPAEGCSPPAAPVNPPANGIPRVIAEANAPLTSAVYVIVQSNSTALGGSYQLHIEIQPAADCDTTEHRENGYCVPNSRNCAVEHGSGSQFWQEGNWGACVVVSCDEGYRNDGNNICVYDDSCPVGYAMDNNATCVRVRSYQGPYGVDLVWLPAGSFTMGSSMDEPGRSASEAQRLVTLTRGFSIGRTEVTQGQWTAVTGGTNPSRYQGCGNTCPVENLDWYSMLAFANHLSTAAGRENCYTFTPTECADELTDWADGQTECTAAEFSGLDCDGFRLPIEAEWEYAYRAGTETAFYNGSILDGSYNCSQEPSLDQIAWYCDNGFNTTHPAAQKDANSWGIYDMAGNVRELMWDGFGNSQYPEATTDPIGPTAGINRIGRGGSFDYYARGARAAARVGISTSYLYPSQGFRLAITTKVGTNCSSDADCSNSGWPMTQFCSAETQPGRCSFGCRNNASCADNQICNGNRECVTGGGAWGASCTDDGECASPMICGTFTGTCSEPCEMTGTDCAGDPTCCPISAASRCNILGFCAN